MTNELRSATLSLVRRSAVHVNPSYPPGIIQIQQHPVIDRTEILTMELLWLWTAAWTLLLLVVWKTLVRDLWFKPRILEAELQKQGLRGPQRSFLAGNVTQMMKMRAESEAEPMKKIKMRAESEAEPMKKISHDIVEYVHPHIVHWSETYGFPFYMWWSNEPSIVVKDLEIIKEVLQNKSGVFGRPAWQQKFQTDLLGRGLVVVNGEEWAFRRSILSPAFHHEKIKGMVDSMVACVSDMLENWSILTNKEDEPVEFEVSEPLSQLTADVISRTAFGSSYQKGEKVFKLLQHLGTLVFQRIRSPWIKSLLPVSKLRREISSAKQELDVTLEEIIKARIQQCKSGDHGSDLLGLMLQEVDKNHKSGDNNLMFTIQSLKEEYKTFYLAGQETTAKLLTWTMLLLGTNSYWQDRAREEVMEVCKTGLPDAEAASKLKIVGMVLNETLRLYPPALFLVRAAYADTRIKSLKIPAGAGVGIPVLSIHHDAEIWGADVDEFNPQRFADGVANASKYPFAFLPFSQGPRVCLGQTFALMEAKVALAMILQKFSFEISPSYVHSPVERLALTPKHGLPLLLRKLF